MDMAGVRRWTEFWSTCGRARSEGSKEVRMSRGAGTGLIGFGIVMVVIGAILDYAVSVHTSGFNINTVGLILLIAGIVSVLVGLVMFFAGGTPRSMMRGGVRAVPRVAGRRDHPRDELAS